MSVNFFQYVWAGAMLFIIAVLTLYMIAHFAHPKDTNFGKSWCSRIIVWIGITISFVPLLVVQLDVDSSERIVKNGKTIDGKQANIKELFEYATSVFSTTWVAIVLIQSAFVWVVTPLMLVYYESNERLKIIERVYKSIKAQLPLFFFIILFTVLTGVFARKAYVPTDLAISTFGVNATETLDGYPGEKFLIIDINSAEHIMICTTFIGQICFTIFAGIGFVSLPWDLFVDYQYRPKPIDEGNFEDKQKLLLLRALECRQDGKKLDENRNYVYQIMGFQGFIARYKFTSQLRTWETKCMQCEQEFTKLQKQTNYNKNVEPMVYTGIMLLGIISLALSSFGYIVVYASMFTKYSKTEGDGTGFTSSENVDQLLQNADPIDKLVTYLMKDGHIYLSNLIFVTQAVYLLLCTLKGNETLGFRFASPLFYPMRSNETQLNSFVFNLFILNVSSLAITLFCCEKMPSFTKNAYIFKFAITFLYSDLMFTFTMNKYTGWIFAVLMGLTILLNVFKGNYRINFKQLEKTYTSAGTFKSTQMQIKPSTTGKKDGEKKEKLIEKKEDPFEVGQ